MSLIRLRPMKCLMAPRLERSEDVALSLDDGDGASGKGAVRRRRDEGGSVPGGSAIDRFCYTDFCTSAAVSGA